MLIVVIFWWLASSFLSIGESINFDSFIEVLLRSLITGVAGLVISFFNDEVLSFFKLKIIFFNILNMFN